MDVTELTTRLVAIDSQNPGPQELGMVQFIEGWARELGFEIEQHELAAGRPNLMVTVDRGGPTTLGLSGHLDTKPIGDAAARWQTNPLELTVDGDLAYGLGATDMKGAIAAMMLTMERFAAAPGSGRLSLVLTADEEQGSDAGAKALIASGVLPHLDALVIGEPSGISEPWEAVHLISRGICCFEVDIFTEQGHSGLSPRLGRNAMLVAADLLRAFEEFRPTYPKGEILCEPTVNPGIFISGGVSYGTWPGRCTVGMEVRLVPGMTQDSLKGEVARAVAAALDSQAHYEIRYLNQAQGWMEAVGLPTTHPIARASQQAASAVLGHPVPFAAFPGSTDATYFLGHGGIPTVTSLGPGWISVAHGANECVGVHQLHQATEIYTGVVERYFDLTRKEQP